MIDQDAKELIKTELAIYVAHAGSANKASVQLDVSTSYITQILKKDDFEVSDDMWRKIANNMGLKLKDKWHHADTAPSKKLEFYFNDARQHANVFGLVCAPGSGKTNTLDYYNEKEKNIFYVKCQRHMYETELLRKLLLTMGRNTSRSTVTVMLDTIRTMAIKKQNPVIIIDEFEKVKTEVLLMFIDLYNALDGVCGIVLIGTENLQDRIDVGYKRGRLGFNEIISRIGGKFLQIPEPTADDAMAVMQANGLTNPKTLWAIVNESKNDRDVIDLRRVKRLVHAEKQKQKLLQEAKA